MSFRLCNGTEIPEIGFGTYLATTNDGKENISRALEAGYRYLDTAAFYFNETEIGEAIEESGISRDELFIASKVWVTNLGYDSVIQSCEESLERLKMDYLDLFLIHWPRPDRNDGWQQPLIESWKAMEYLYNSGKVKAIGVSNFLPHHFKVIEDKWTVKPMVNQLELHIGYLQEAACQYCRENDILIQAWSPLGRRALFEEKAIKDVADKYGVSVSKLALRFLNQLGISVIPKASSLDRMKENLNILDFTISDFDMSYLRCLPQMGWSGEHPDFFDID